MKVGLNATCFNNRPSGAGQRFVGIYRELIKCLPDSEFIVYEPADCAIGDWFEGAPNVVTRRTPVPSEGRARKFIGGLPYWRSALPNEDFDIFEQFNLPLIKFASGRTLLTIHDIRGLQADAGALERSVFRSVLGRSLRMADHVVTVSEAMKEELLGVFPGISISVIYNGIDAVEFERVSDSELLAFRQKFTLPQEFILSVGHIEKRKNFQRLVEAIACLRDEGRSCCLVIIGNDSGERAEIDKRIRLLNLESNVKVLSCLTDLEVRCAYKACNLFVFPSIYEGFGIPILEAMAVGCPLVLSDIPVFREITQNRGVYFPWDHVESMAHVIDDVLSSTSERKRLVEYGRTRVGAFSFHSLAAQLECLYRSLL